MITNYFEKIRMNAGDTERSVQWYQTQIKRLGAFNTQRMISTGGSNLKTTILPGFMYMFFYDPKYKETLPYYDRFPLVLPFRKVPGGFYGLNLHYLPYIMRFKILGLLIDYASDDKMTEDTRLRLSWRLLESSSRLKPVHACVKHYLYDHVETKFLMVPSQDWITASQLPVERFVNANKTKVWEDSRKIYQ